MDASQILQTVLSAIQAGAGNTTTGSSHLSGSAANANGTVPMHDAGAAAPAGAVQLLMTLLSMSAVRDWMKLLLIGAFLETCRRLITQSWESIQDYFWLTATFEMHEDPADWILHWAAQRKMFDAARHVEITSGDYILENMVDVFGNDEAKVAFYPSMDKKYRLWYKGRYLTIKREQKSPNSVTRAIQVLELRILSRNPAVLRELLMEARKGYTEASKNVINVYVTESSDHWKHVASQQKRPASSVILDPGVFELVLADARDFINSKRWYASRGIPFRRGYLLYGAPGAGKTSMIHSLAGELNLNIYILSLTVMALDDNSLKSLIARLPEKCVLLIEDIDAAFHRGMKRNIVDPEKKQQTQRGGTLENGQPAGPPGEKDKDKPDGFFNGVTLSGLLNALDGIAAQEGRILFATTNDYSALDPALLRPGRLDLHVEFQLASRHQARELFKRFFTPDEEEEKLGVAATHLDLDEKQADSDSGYTSANSTPPAELASASAPGQASPPAASQLPGSVRSVYVGGMAHGGTGGLPRLSAKQAAALAERFAEIVPPQAFSMATLQGYLMAYKVRPLDAIADAPGWVESKLREKAAASASQPETPPQKKEMRNTEGAAAVA